MTRARKVEMLRMASDCARPSRSRRARTSSMERSSSVMRPRTTKGRMYSSTSRYVSPVRTSRPSKMRSIRRRASSGEFA